MSSVAVRAGDSGAKADKSNGKGRDDYSWQKRKWSQEQGYAKKGKW